MITEEQFDKWVAGLSRHDRMNFETLIGLPKAKEIVEKMPEGQYKDMANFIIDKGREMAKQMLGLN